MCGRFTLSTSTQTLVRLFELTDVPEIEVRYNIAPTQEIPAVRVSRGKAARELVRLQWGLVPAWAKDPAMGSKLINARSETVIEKPSFRAAFKSRRCLIPADGFYEWGQVEGRKQPFYFRRRDGQPFAFAGLWEHWEDEQQRSIDSCTILTTSANDVVRPVHERMPVILAPEDFALWLDPTVRDTEQLQALLRPYPADQIVAYPVGTAVNSARHDAADCIEPLNQS